MISGYFSEATLGLLARTVMGKFVANDGASVRDESLDDVLL
jgi:hypothetical protein